MSLIVILVIFLLGFVEGKNEEEVRVLSIEYLFPPNDTSPYCTNLTCVNLVHTIASGPKDDLHYIHSTLGLPSILVVKTSKNSSLKVDWERFLSSNVSKQGKSVNFTFKKDGRVLSSAIFLFNKMFIFNDPQDKADLNDKSVNKIVTVGLDELSWLAATQSTEDIFAITFASKMIVPKSNKTQDIVIKFKAASGFESSTSDLPHMLLNNNLTQIDVSLNHVFFKYDDDDGDDDNVTITNPRVALELILLTPKEQFESSFVSVEKSLDDELSPGAFRTVNWLSNDNQLPNATTPDKNALKPGVFVQWKPICYTNFDKSIQSVTQVHNYDIHHYNNNDKNTLIPITIATGFYGVDYLGDKMNRAGMNVSFGMMADKWYSNTEYIAWQLTLGIGDHPQNGISTLTILIIAIGLGVPILFLVIAAIYLPIRSCCLRRRRGYEELSSSYPEIS